jgi:nucleoside-diphosphate-sugar epimerase
VVGRGDNWWDVVRVEDVASACIDAAERAPGGSLYHVVDDEPIRYYDFVALTAEAAGVGPPRRIPAWLARLAAGGDPVAAAVRSARSSNQRIKRELAGRRAIRPLARGFPTPSRRSAESQPKRPRSRARRIASGS